MEIRIQSVHFNADSKLLGYIREKVDKLMHYYDRILAGEIILKLDKSADLHNKVVHVKLHIPGNDLFVEEKGRSFEEATDIAVDVLARQIKKRKEKMRRV